MDIPRPGAQNSCTSWYQLYCILRKSCGLINPSWMVGCNTVRYLFWLVSPSVLWIWPLLAAEGNICLHCPRVIFTSVLHFSGQNPTVHWLGNRQRPLVQCSHCRLQLDKPLYNSTTCIYIHGFQSLILKNNRSLQYWLLFKGPITTRLWSLT